MICTSILKSQSCHSSPARISALIACGDHHTATLLVLGTISVFQGSSKVQPDLCYRIQKQCHCTIKHSSEPGRFMLAGCPWISVTSRSFCRALLFDPWPILKLEDSHCEGLSGDILQLRPKYKQLCPQRSVFWMTRTWSPYREGHPIVLPLATFTHSSQKGSCCSLLNE